MFSIIVPNYNHAPFLEERIDSILQQSYGDFELIIFDDCSTDNSREIIGRYRDHQKVSKIIFAEKNSGSPFRAWNEIVPLATREWIWVAESDDIADENFLQEMADQIAKDKNIALAYSDAVIKDEIAGNNDPSLFSIRKNRFFNTNKWNESYINNGVEEINDFLKFQCTINNVSSVVFNAKLLKEELTKIKDYRLHGDWLLYLLLGTKGKIAYVAKPLNIYREHVMNYSKTDLDSKLSKSEHFRILDFLLRQGHISEKKKLFRWFDRNYIGFGFIKEKGLGKGGLFRAYWKINPSLALKGLFRQLTNRITGKKQKA